MAYRIGLGFATPRKPGESWPGKGLTADETQDIDDVTYYVGHERVLHRTDGCGLPFWKESLFAFLQRNSAHISEFVNLPRDAVVEIGRQIEI